ncbi:hypothetical protein PCC8801_3245 [Rippkaea orientalis PCC 8801]|uniref:Uncharacterized protein n=1 Tax=Rippkaea orientalis (strain PCC 8801 / RF-1) TaxID=41431 RepID=B7JYB7_RIPO1|nr:hypothetical protein [Rippkaea orientalis]ACK67219.1 hypothetical protein PCC8801_3245 [Rippkaea orientalis PCC 8801]
MITLNFDPELEKNQQEANLQGLSIEAYLKDLIEERLTQTNTLINYNKTILSINQVQK